MDATSSSFGRLGDGFRSLPESTRRLVLGAIAAVLIAAVWLGSRRTGSETVLNLDADAVPAAVLANLHERGLTTARLNEAGKLVVPAARAAEAGQWIEELSASTTTWADEWEKSNSQLGQFSGTRERDTAREITRARMIGRLLRQMPGIAQADVIWDEEESAGWRQPKRTRCTVYLRPKTGFEITPDVAQSVRQAVAGSKKNLAPADIVVMDLGRMATFDAVPGGVDEHERSQAERQVAELRREIEAALRDCPGVRVNVGVTWIATDAADSEVSLSANRGNGGANAGASLSTAAADSLSSDFEPRMQITVTASEPAAVKWARTNPAPSPEADVIPASWSSTDADRSSDSRSNSTAASIRRTVGSILNRYGRQSIPAAVSVHLLPAAKVARPSLRDLAHESPIDPVWFAAIAAAVCLAGAWMLASLFQRSVVTQSAAPRGMEVEPTVWSAAGSGLLVDGLPDHQWPEEMPEPVAEFTDFEELIHCPPAVWPAVWDQASLATWVAALKGASLQLRRTVLSNLSPDDAQQLQLALEQSPPPRLSEIDESQSLLLALVQRPAN